MTHHAKTWRSRTLELALVAASTAACTRTGESASAAGSSSPQRALAGSAQQTPLASQETAILAGGCFWGMEDILRKVPGVIATDVGYTGGTGANPTYRDVSAGDTGHAEAVRVVFDPKRLRYETLLEQWFFRMHDPTTANRQGNDVGTQYRSAIFVLSEEQRRAAEAVKHRMNESGKWNGKIVTQIVDAGPFTPAEDYHQDYLQKNPGGYTCHFIRDI